jgi:hypothetical protein
MVIFGILGIGNEEHDSYELNLVVNGFDFSAGSCLALQDGLGKNLTLECLELRSVDLTEAYATAFSFYFTAIKAVQPNKTLKTLYLCYGSPQMTDDEVKEMTSLVKQNYGLESLPGINYYGERMGDVRAILQLNGTGRRYLKDDASSILKGVDVLSAISDDLNCVFLHLLENPSLCDRRH